MRSTRCQNQRQYFIRNYFEIIFSTYLYAYIDDFQSDTIKILWTFGEKDPVYGNLKWHGTHGGARSIHLISPLWKKPNFNHNNANRDIRQWDVAVKNVSTRTFY